MVTIIESMADRWMESRVVRILRASPRLGQPKYISGYLEARLIEWRTFASEHESGKDLSAFVKEMRCRKTGAQPTTGDVLSVLQLDPNEYTNPYEVLRQASEGVGTDYADAAGRRHKLYVWGDLRILVQRINEGGWKLRTRRYERQEGTEREFELEPDDLWDIPI